MAKHKQNTKKSENTNSYLELSHLAIVVVLLAIYLAAGWSLVRHIYTTNTVKMGSVGTSQDFLGNDYRNSLDLRIAKKATYPSSEIKTVSFVKTVSGIKYYNVNYQVMADGLSEYALMSMPATPAPVGGYPVVILCHAYIYPAKYKTDVGYLADMKFYSQHGFVVIKPDFRGQGLSKSQGVADGANYSMVYNTDVMSLISAIKQTSYLDKNAINLWGHSMGAYIAFRASVLSPDVKSVILLAGPVSSFSKMYSGYKAPSDISNPIAARVKSEALIRYGTPKTNPDFWAYASPFNYLNSSKAYYQIHVGTKDVVVPPKFSADLDKQLSKIGANHQYFVYQGAKHNLLNVRTQIWDRSLKVLAGASN